ncbi:hypothetical protein EON65_04840 [archaeon]|nr:MAG: hypothetical protein EON65_04840 [archaeon]
MQEFKLFTPPPSRAQATTPLEPHFVEAQVLSQTSQLVFKPESTRLEPLGGKCGVRKVMPLISSAFPWAKAVSRQLKTTVENTIYVYPIQFDRFPSNYRNICSKIELIELRGNLPDRKLPNAFTAHDVLCSIYNHSSITGSSFVKEAYTRVSYHAKNPVTNDEFKIRLPDVLTSRHWIKFTAYHVHVKLQGGRGSILQSIIRTSNDKEDSESSVIGIGYLPLMLSGDCLIGDEEHLVLLLNQEADVNKMTLETRETNSSFSAVPVGAAIGVEIPSIRVRTRSLCSLVSMDRKVQTLFKNNPIPLGYLPSSIMPLDVAGKICYRACSLEPKEVRLTASLVDVTRASNIELCRHFLAVFRMLVRSLLGGTCAYNQSYICPYQHLPARSQAFLTMIILFDKIFGDIGNSSAALNDSSREREVLDVCVDYLLDEEMPIPEDYVHKIATHYMIRANSNADMSQPSSAPSSSYSSNIQPFSPSHLDLLLQSKASNISFKEGKDDISNEIVAEEEDASTSVRASPAVENNRSTPVSIQPIDISRPISIRSVALSENTTEGISGNRVSVSSDDESGKGEGEEESVGITNHVIQTVTPEKSVQEEDIRQSSTTANTDTLEQPSSSSVESSPEISRKVMESIEGAPSVQFDLPKLSSNLIDDDEDDIYDHDDVPDEPRVTSADRRSWGGYITDSMWLSGRFSAVSSLRTGAVDLENDLASKYLDDIAQHIVLQVSRLVEERLINVAVHTIAKVVEYNSSNNVDPELNMTEEFVLAGKRYRYSGAFDTMMPPLPFETEKAWFKSIDDGQLIDKEDLSVNSALNLQHLNKRLSSVRILERESLHLGVVEPMYDNLEGYDSRLEMSIAPDPHFAIMKHWWPYLYEVLTYQWAAVLILVSSQGFSEETITNEFPVQFTIDQAKEYRNLVMEHGPIMLRMIHKSLALRINREGKRPPVMLDNQYFNLLEILVAMLATEACSVASTVWRSRRVVQALAKFINSLFALIAPKQVLKLIRTYFKALRGSKSPVEETEQRLLFLQEMSYFDHAVAVNFPYTLDAPLSLFLGSIDDIDNPTDETLAVSYSFTGIRFALCPTPYTLAYTIISEVMTSYRLDSNKRQPALAILRDILVRHAFDARYQKPSKQQRIACMYIPVLGEFMRELDRLWILKYDSVERREMLAIVLYIFGGIPDRILRAILRHCCMAATSRSNSSKKDFRFSTMMDSSSSTMTAALRVLSLKRDSALATPDVEAFIPQSTVQSLDIYSLILMLHLSLDTFELPKTKEDTVCTDMFSPAIVIDGAASTNIEASVSTNGLASVGSGSGMRRTSGAATESKGSNATALLANLDNRLQRKAAGSSRKSLPGVGKGDERRWAEHVRKMAKEQARAKRVSMKTVPIPVAQSASSQLSLMSTRVILNTMWMMLEECPTALDNVEVSDVFVLRDCNIEESLLAGILNLRIVPFIRMSLCVLLHGLFCNQTEEMVVDLFLSTVSVIRKFGAKMFLLAVEDSLQYWLRIAIFYCGFSNPAIQGGACDFLLCMLRACFHYFGSFTLISNTLLAVLGDSLDEILDYNRQSIKTYADEDRQLKHVTDAIDSMRSAAKEKLQSLDQRGLPVRSPFCLSLLTFLNSLDVLLVAHSDLRRYVTHPVGYDFYGANLLDGPWDARTTVLVQALRMRRRAVTSDPGEQNSAAKAGFQIEEVMMRFVAASEVYDAFRLPRFRMFWLENLARLHELCGNRAEGAEIRWRIFSLANELQDSWMKLWSPRPPLLWLRRGNTLNAADSSAIANNIDPARKTATENDRNFYKVLIRALDAKCMHPWLEHSQYTTHMITSLSVAAERFCSTNLVHLAERASAHLVTLYRLGRKTDLMISEYSRMANALKATNDKGINITLAMGTFYRVYYDGLGVPAFLRKKEFIFRNANHLHVSEFHALVMSHLKAVVGEGIEVKMIQDANAQADYNDPKTAYLIMNSVKLVMNKGHVNTVNKASARISKSFQNCPVETLNQVSTFTFSVPFTQDGSRAHAKKIDEQWLRTTVLYTREFFPYILTRQLVINREITLLCPIEVASVDIEDRIEAMEMELTVESKDTNNLMRIVQGTVLPQVGHLVIY